MLEEKLRAALDQKSTDVKSFIWKGKKEEVNGVRTQKEQRLVDASEEELNTYFRHCNSMLYNEDKMNPGRYPLLSIIKDQRMRCNVELFLRWIDQENGMSRYKFMESLKNFIDNNKANIPDIVHNKIKIAVGGCPKEFEDLIIDDVLDGCLDKLGILSKKHITLAFIVKQGLWLNESEKKEFKEIVTQNEKLRSIGDAIKERLRLTNADVKLWFNPKGLSLAQFRAMVELKDKKYSDLTTEQLKTLRNRILFSLESDVMFHIEQWETRRNQIMQVCEYKGITLQDM